MLDIEFIPRILYNMVIFLKPILPESIINEYSSILEMDPIDQKSAVQRIIKPYEFCLHDFIIDCITRNNLDVNDFKEEDILKFKRYLTALCEVV